MIRVGLIVWLAFCPAVAAQDLPAQFRVTGVDAGDVLNIRQRPSAQSDKIGEVGPYDINVEVLALSENGRWGRIGLPEGNGWVAMRYLELQETADEQTIPRPLSCFGTEPFWRIGLLPKGDEFERLGEDRIDLQLQTERPGETGWQARHTTEDGAAFNLVVTRGNCGDGMSDREFGWQATLYVDRAGGAETLQGCCTLDHRSMP